MSASPNVASGTDLFFYDRAEKALTLTLCQTPYKVTPRVVSRKERQWLSVLTTGTRIPTRSTARS